MTSIISQIVTGVEDLGKDASSIWNAVEKDVANDVAAFEKAFPAASPAVNALAADVKQGASDALGVGAQILGTAQPVIVSGAEALANSGLLALTGGAATPALPGVDGWIEGVGNGIISAVQAWMLKQKGMLATATTAKSPQPASGAS